VSVGVAFLAGNLASQGVDPTTADGFSIALHFTASGGSSNRAQFKFKESKGDFGLSVALPQGSTSTPGGPTAP
jgi:hypothetical protein